MEIAVFSTGTTSPSRSLVVRQRHSSGECRVCGAVAKSHNHYGALCCIACRSFFRRTVQSGAYAQWKSDCDGRCYSISKSGKNATCRLCRFKKCLDVGMNPKWVVSNEGDSAKWEIARSSSPKTLFFDERLTSTEQDCIDRLVGSYRDVVVTSPMNITDVLSTTEISKDVKAAYAFSWSLRRIILFLWQLPEVDGLCSADTEILRECGANQMSLLRASFAFENASGKWPRQNSIESHSFNFSMTMSTMDEMISETLIEKTLRVVSKLYEMYTDEQCIMLLMMIIFFSPERYGLSNPEQVGTTQEKMLFILKKYIRCRYGGAASRIYAKLLTVLVDLQDIIDQLDEKNLFLLKDQVEIFQAVLGQWNPYKRYALRKETDTNVLSEIDDAVLANNLPCGDVDELDDLLEILETSQRTAEETTDKSNWSVDTDLFHLLEDIDDLF